MNNLAPISIVLRYRDLITELGGTIAEHRKLMRHHGFVWWGWWRRQWEQIPKHVLSRLFNPNDFHGVPIILFDSGILKLYGTVSSKAVVAPSVIGIQTPQLEATPEYYVRGRFPVWFRLEKDITPIDATTVFVISRPTAEPESDPLPKESIEGEAISLGDLRDEGPTFWLAKSF